MEREVLAELVERGLSTAQIAAELDRHPRIVAGWLREHGLQTSEVIRRRKDGVKPGTRRPGVCERHGEVEFVARGQGGWRCVRCRSEQVSDARRRRKAQLVAEAGGCCAICGYSRSVNALHFHHIDPSTKRYGLAHRRAARSLASMRAEAAKCVLVCSNCHAELESGLVEMPVQ
jgi:hypothetical protein